MTPPLKCCSFLCPEADNTRAQHAACLAVNGVYCGKLRRVVEKGAPCPDPAKKPPRGTQPNLDR